MSRNLTWCLVQNLLRQNSYRCLRQLPQETVRRFKHAAITPRPEQTENTHSIDYHEVKTYQEFLEESNTGAKTSVKVLMSLLGIQRDTAVQFTKQWKIFNHLTKPAILKNYQSLRDAGVFKSTIRHNVHALADRPSNVQTKIKSLTKMKLEVNYGVPLFQLNAMQLLALANITTNDRIITPNYRNRIEYLADTFNCHLSTMCTILCSHPQMLTFNMEKIVGITNFLLDEMGMKREHLLNDLVIYRYALPNIKERMYRAKNVGMTNMKPWVVRCPIAYIEKLEEKRQNWDEIVGPGRTFEEHLSKIMNCNVEDATCLVRHYPDMRSICIKKITQTLQFLAGVGYTIHDVYRTPSIMYKSEDTITYKYQRWVNAGLEYTSLRILNLSEKRFEEKLQEEISKKVTSEIAS
ncbi:uncharacterized protein LOC135165731 [Diachasmimorpha longicaudata]|uniref:uncharacterized protein LOC135165731 n=1 Tax=Diachasmimorpha longicaudata TaxID=58733 RepID=UPI0030B880FE